MPELAGTINLSGARIVAYIYGFSVRTRRFPDQGFQCAYWSPAAHEGVVSQTRHQTSSSSDAITRATRALPE
jgi:hypothetical protein